VKLQGYFSSGLVITDVIRGQDSARYVLDRREEV